MELIRHSRGGNLLHNEKTGFYEVWRDGRRVMELMETEEKSAVETLAYLFGETWEPNGEQGSK